MSDKLYQVEKVIGRREVDGKVWYKVHWEGYSSRWDSWEPAVNLGNCQDLIDDFHQKERRLRTRKQTATTGAAATQSSLQTVELSSDEEITPLPTTKRQQTRVSTGRPPRKRRTPARQTRQQKPKTAPTKAEEVTKEEDVEVREEEEEKKETQKSKVEGKETSERKSYELRMTRQRQEMTTPSVALSSDEEPASSRPAEKTFATPRLTLSQIRQAPDEQAQVSQSKQFPEDPSPPLTRAKARLRFEAKAATTASQLKTTVEQETEQPSGSREEVPFWMQIGWAEVAFATIVTFLVGVGVTCSLSDFC